MIAYEFYLRDGADAHQLIAILPERRKTPGRATPESIINWGKQILGDDIDLGNLLYVTTTIDEDTGEIFSSPSAF